MFDLLPEISFYVSFAFAVIYAGLKAYRLKGFIALIRAIVNIIETTDDGGKLKNAIKNILPAGLNKILDAILSDEKLLNKSEKGEPKDEN